jgi:tetratricopeptide (TPR) repeat protein
MELRLYSALFGVAMLAMVGVFTLFPQLTPEGVQIHWGKGGYASPGRFPAPNRGLPTRSASWSTSAPSKAEAAFDRGTLNLEREEWDLAVKEFDEVLRLDPKNADAFYNRGAAKFAKQQYDGALADIDAAVRLRPRDADALLARAAVRIEQGLPKLAIGDLDAALGIDPENVEAYCERGKLREESGEYRLALYDYQLALKRASDDPLVLNYLAWLLSTAPDPALRDGPRAIELAVRAVKLENSKEWDTIDTLAAAFAESGKFPEAVRAEQEALKLAPSEEHPDLRSRLELYQAKRAYRLGGP